VRITQTRLLMYVACYVCSLNILCISVVTNLFLTSRPAVYEVNSTLEFNYWMGNYSVLFMLAHDQEIVSSWQVSHAFE